ncbi:MAG: sugar ABC transporter ATP-binding protein [Magnetococcus sp. WYHC-3]
MAEMTAHTPATPLPAAFEMRGIRKRFGATLALSGVDLAVQPGEVHALVGENGAGKSTLMKVLSGAEIPDAGEMFRDGAPYAPRSPLEARRHGVGMIYQELSLADHLTVAENLTLGLEPTRLGCIRRNETRRIAVETMAKLGHPEILPEIPVSRLTIAERQLVEIGRAIASGCRVLVFDEPTSSLALEDVQRLFGLIRTLQQQGHAIVYISHFLEEVRAVANRFTILRDGQTAGSGVTATTSIDEMVSRMVGRRIEQLYPRSMRQPGETLLTAKDLAGIRKPLAASLTLRRGEVLGIAGLVGSGRTELMRAIFSLDKIRRGEIRVGAYTGPSSPVQRLAQGVGLLSEDRKGEGLAVSLNIADNITLSRLAGLGPLGLVLPSRQHAAAQRWIQKLSIRCQGPGQRVVALSGGNQQKVALSRLLHHDVDLLLLDEPTKGIDVASKAQIYELIDELTRGQTAEGRLPRAILMVSSHLPELLGVCDRIAVMCRGVLGPARPVSAWDEHKLLLEATGQAALKRELKIED